MVILCILNYIRVKFGGEILWNCRGFKTAPESEDGGHDDGGRYGITTRCSLLHLQLYFFCGLLISSYVAIVYLVGIIYVLRYNCDCVYVINN
jgi:hypothetical protein